MFIVIELQTTGAQTANIVTAYETQQAAEAKYHSILAAAAVSGVEIHAAAILSEEGFPLRNECYKHEATPAEEPEGGED